MIFRPDRPFEPGETVTVSGSSTAGGEKVIFTHDFTVAKRLVHYEPDPYGQAEPYERDINTGGLSRQVSALEILESGGAGDALPYSLPPDFPVCDITVFDEPEDGKLFLATITPRNAAPQPCYIMILEKDGTPYFFRKIPGRVVDFKKQPNGLLSYAWTKPGPDYFHTLDNTYSEVDSYTTVNGYELDSHDFVMLPNGHVMMIADDPEIVDMSGIVEGGHPQAEVIGSVIQELDASGNLVFQWRTRDFFDILDTNVDLTGRRIRYSHVNAIEVDHDGHIMISSRHMSEITKIDRDTGQIIWRMGGNRNEFTLVGDTLWYSRQHDIRRIDNGNVTIYDNGNLNDPRESRSLEYELDEENLVATRVWEYRNDPPIYAGAQGSSRRLPGGNTLIGWGNCRYADITEVRPDGSIAFEMYLPTGLNTYRAFKEDWEGTAAAPYAWADTTGGELRLHFTKFGDDDVKRYYVYRGTDPSPAWKAYVTCGNSVRIRDFEQGETLYFRIVAEGGCGAMSEWSNEVSVTPGFSDEPEVADALVKVTPRTLNLLSEGRWISAHIEFPKESGLDVSCIDRTCILFNDVVLAEMRSCDGKGGLSPKKLMVKFPRSEVQDILAGDNVMVKVSGYVGELAFEAFDHLKIVSEDTCGTDDSGEDTGGEEPDAPSLSRNGRIEISNYPNPFNPATVISFTLPLAAKVDLRVYDVGGRLVSVLADGTMTGGTHEVAWNGKDSRGRQLASGIYFYRLRSGETEITRKMILLR
jgi:outer membrane protein assembly factor BamB